MTLTYWKFVSQTQTPNQTSFRFAYDIGLHNFDEAFDKNEENEKQIIIQRITDSKLVIIDQFIYDDKSDIYLVIGFHKTIIIVKDSLIQLFQPLFANNTQLKFYFLQYS